MNGRALSEDGDSYTKLVASSRRLLRWGAKWYLQRGPRLHLTDLRNSGKVGNLKWVTPLHCRSGSGDCTRVGQL